jgi:nucleoside-diphosphate-sugar epimerase
MQARRNSPLPATDELSMYALPRSECMHVEPSLRRRPKTDHNLHFWTRNYDARTVKLAIMHEQRRNGRPSGLARRARLLVGGAAENEVSLYPRGARARFPSTLGRFFQSPGSECPYLFQMKILVTGATGKVGSRLSKRLAERDHRVRALVRDATRALDLRDAGIELAEGDLLEVGSLAAAVRGVDAVVHCAAFFRGASPEQAHAVNDLGTQHLARAASAASVNRFIFTSTGLVYGSNGGRLAGEDDPCAATAPYPVSKLGAERFLLAFEGLDVRVLRLPFVYGDGDPHIEEAIPMMQGFPPQQRMSIAHHADVAQAVARLLDARSPAHRVYNLVDDEAPDAAALFASVGAPPPNGSDADRARAFDALLDGRRIREDLGFKPRYPRLADAIAAGT